MKKRNLEPKKIVIIGGGGAAKEAAVAARKQDPTCSITILAEESYLPYYRPFLTEYLSHDINEKRFYLADDTYYREHHIDIYLNDPVISILPEGKKVITASQNHYAYDQLILAIGSYNFVPFPQALQKKGVFSIRTYDDAKEVKEYTNKVKKAIVVGGGLLGLEAAWKLLTKGMEVTVIELMDRILPLQLDAICSEYFKQIIEAKGVHLKLGKAVKQILGDELVSGVELDDGTILPCDLLLFSVGIRPNIDLVKNTGLEINRGIIVNDKMETSLSAIYAAGDVVEFQGKVNGTWPPALLQGKVAGTNAAGGSMTYVPPIISTMLSAFETRIFSIGDLGHIHKESSYKCLSFKDIKNKVFRQLYFLESQLVGGILIGDIRYSTKLIKGIANKTSVEKAKDLFDL